MTAATLDPATATTPAVTLSQYAPVVGVLADLVRRAGALTLWSITPHCIDGQLSVYVQAGSASHAPDAREAAAAWGAVLGEYDEHVAASGALHCEAFGLVCGVAVRVLAIVEAPARVVDEVAA